MFSSCGAAQTPAFLYSLTAVAFVKGFSRIECNLLLRKITEVAHSKCFVFSELSCLFFTSNSAVFVGEGEKIFLLPGA